MPTRLMTRTTSTERSDRHRQPTPIDLPQMRQPCITLAVLLLMVVTPSSIVSMRGVTNAQLPERHAAASPFGMDILLLVDASGSMSRSDGDLDVGYLNNNAWNGSDPQRIRWDAVKLLLDLLDVNDRLLVRRFNEHAPPLAHSPKEYVYDRFINDQTPFDYQQHEFLSELSYCTTDYRELLTTQIEFFNRPLNRQARPLRNNRYLKHDDGWTLDQGGTNILQALSSLAPALKTDPERPKRIILLTDGCDRYVDKYLTQENPPNADQVQIDADRLQAALGGVVGDGVDVPAVPVYCVGLNLDELSDDTVSQQLAFSQTKARLLMRAIADASGGDFLEVSDASNLLQTYNQLIRQIKGLWYRETDVDPAATGQLSIPIVSEVADFRLLAWVPDHQSAPVKGRHSEKLSMRPPDVCSAGLEPSPSGQCPPPDPSPRNGGVALCTVVRRPGDTSRRSF